MAKTRRAGTRRISDAGHAARVSPARLEQLIEEATVDCYNDSEQVSGLYTMVDDNLELPFETEVLGARVIVEGVDVGDDESIVAVCRKGPTRQRIPLIDLPLPVPPPRGAEWVAAYRRWAKGR